MALVVDNVRVDDLDRSRVPRGLAHFALLLAALGAPLAVLATRVLTPDPRGYGTHEQLGLAECALRESLGFPCPACGVTTSVVLVARGDLPGALATQPFGALLALLTPLLAVLALGVHLAGRDLARIVVAGRWARFVAALMGSLLIAAWLYKIRRLAGTP